MNVAPPASVLVPSGLIDRLLTRMVGEYWEPLAQELRELDGGGM